MATVFDSAAFAVEDRAAAFEAALNTEIFPSIVRLDRNVPAPMAESEAWNLGSMITVVRIVSTGHSITRTPAQIRRAPSDAITLGTILNGTARVHQGQYALKTGKAYGESKANSPLLHLLGTVPFELQFRSAHEARSVATSAYFDPVGLNLPVDIIDSTLPHLSISPPVLPVSRPFIRAFPGGAEGGGHAGSGHARISDQ